MPAIEFGCRPTIVGSLPHTAPDKACAAITHYIKDIPAWPQLPKRAFVENMYAQYSQGFPGAVVEKDRIYIDRAQDLSQAMEEFYTAYLEGDVDKFPITADYAAGLHRFLALDGMSPLAAKGQLTGPVTWGLTVTDQDKRSIIYDETLGDVVPQLLRLKAGWMEKQLKRLSDNTIVFLDEPYMAAFGSVGVMLSKEQVINLENEVFAGISGRMGVHCCANTDWSILLQTAADIISFDAYGFAGSLALYPAAVKAFIARGGTIAWGIVPSNAEAIEKETAASLHDRLDDAMAPFTREGIPAEQLIRQGLLTPSCGMGSMASEESAELVLERLAELSARVRKRHTV